MNHSPSSAQSAELPTVARLYYTGIGHRRYKRASTRSGTGEPLCFVSVAEERLKVARATAEYWKAEHNAANQRIAELEANAAAVATPLEEANRLLHEQLDTARDTIGKLRAAASSQATGQPEPIYQVQTSCNGWSDHSRAEYEAARLSRRIVYATPPSPDAASAHTIGEDAANGAIGEREAFLTWWCADVPEYMREKWKESVDECLRNNHAQDKLVGAWDGFQFGLTVARAALTAEKVAGQEADLSAENWAAVFHTAFRHAGDSESASAAHSAIEAMDNKEWLQIVDYMLIGIRRKLTATQQPAQPVAQTLALTDEQIEDLQEAREILENMVSSVELDGNYSTEATCTFLRQALLCLPAAQPASGGESC